MAEIAIALPFRVDPSGNIAVANTQSKIWADRVRGVIGTTFRERIMRSQFGSALVESLFEEADETTLDISSQVQEAFIDFLPDLTLVDVVVTDDSQNGTMNVEVTYQLPNEKEVTTTIGYVEIRGSLPPIETLVTYQERFNEQ